MPMVTRNEAAIIAVTKWQAHTVRGFVSIFRSKGGEKVESSKSADGEQEYKIFGRQHPSN